MSHIGTQFQRTTHMYVCMYIHLCMHICMPCLESESVTVHVYVYQEICFVMHSINRTTKGRHISINMATKIIMKTGWIKFQCSHRLNMATGSAHTHTRTHARARAHTHTHTHTEACMRRQENMWRLPIPPVIHVVVCCMRCCAACSLQSESSLHKLQDVEQLGGRFDQMRNENELLRFVKTQCLHHKHTCCAFPFDKWLVCLCVA